MTEMTKNTNYMDEMTAIERNNLYNKGKEVDRLPCGLISAETGCTTYGITPRDCYSSSSIIVNISENLIRDFEADSIAIGPGLRGLAEAAGSKINYPENNICYVENPIALNTTDYSKFPMINPYKDGRLPILLEALKIMADKYEDKYIISNDVCGPISTAIALRGTENVLRDMVRNPESVHMLLDYGVKITLQWIETVYQECGVKPGISEPMISNEIMSLKQFQNFAKPHVKELIKGINKITGLNPGIHICGKTKKIWPEIIELGVTSFSVDNCESLLELKKTVGDKIAIAGNVPPVNVIGRGQIPDIIKAVKKCIYEAADSPNGYTISAGCQIPLNTPKENLYAYMWAVRKYGKHAIKSQLPQGLFITN